MSFRVGRRTVLASAASAAASAFLPLRVMAAEPPGTSRLEFGPANPFDFDQLAERARLLASEPYRTPRRPLPEIVAQIDYAVHGQIDFRRQNALYAERGAYPVTFFHLGNYFPTQVRMFAVSGGSAREILYSPDYFSIPEDSIARQLPADAGFAGFRLHESNSRPDWRTQDWVAFLGASYFRAIGELGQYGLSARGIAVDTAVPGPEEFPEFLEFYISPAESDEDPVVVHALLDGPRISGAYRFEIRRTEGVVMDIEKRLFLRGDIARLGIAPLTSMFWFAEYGRERLKDWRPDVHDSDGLAMDTGAGERIWRPLNNPAVTRASAFSDENPRGFGLLQRDRDSENYLDGVRYERRPSLWVEPLGDWGRGSIQCIEIPTDDEIHDNIGVFWVPEAPAVAGASFAYRYRLHWLADEPYPASGIARAVATRMGRGGEPGKPRPPGLRKFVVEFEGGPLTDLGPNVRPEAVVDSSHGEVSYVFTEPVPGTKRWRAQFDVAPARDEVVELRLYLSGGGHALSETWLYQLDPTSA